MKEYKSITIILENVLVLGSRLNEYAKKGWYIKDTITNGMPSGDSFEFIYLMERETKGWEGTYETVGKADNTILESYNNKINFTAINKEAAMDKFWNEIEIPKGRKPMHITEVKI